MTPKTLSSPLLRAALTLVTLSTAAGCNCGTGPIVVSPNTAPLITLEEPQPNEDGTPIVVAEGQGIVFAALVSDAEDSETDLIVQWTADRTDAAAPAVEIGTVTPDSTGWAEILVPSLDQGFWQITGRVVDSQDAFSEAGMPVEFLGSNITPEVAISLPQNGDEFELDAPVTFTGSVSDDGEMSDMSVEWFSSLDGVLNTNEPSVSGLITFTDTTLSEGTHTVTVTVTDDRGAQGTDSVQFEVLLLDQPPSTPSVLLQPSSPFTDADLVCNASGSSDPEGQPVTYIYSWTKDGLPYSTPTNTNLIPSSETRRDESWICEVRANDGTLDSEFSGSDGVVIQNTVPSIDGATLLPAPGFEDSILTCAGGNWDDLDGDPEEYLTTWTVNSVDVVVNGPNVLDGASFDKGDTVSCEVTPVNDGGFPAGVPFSAGPIDILNSPPGDGLAELTPTTTAFQLEDLLCTMVTAPVDPDPNDLVTVEYRWLVDGVHDPSYDGATFVPGADPRIGEEWTCELRGNDGIDAGDWTAVSTLIVPDVGDLVITEFHARPSYVSDVAGEWIEIYNNSMALIDLRGFELRDDGSDSHFISGIGPAGTDPLELPPFARIALTRYADFSGNGGVFSLYEYSNFALDDDVDQIVLAWTSGSYSIEVDRVDYDLTGYPLSLDGHALALNPDLGTPDAVTNDDPFSWCGSTSPIDFPGTDFGTPGGANDACQCWYSDNDGDFYGTDPSCVVPDCDDSLPGTNPAAEDLCENGVDENCDGADAICPCLDTDDDGDGFGDGAGCALPDCDDADPSIFPGAVESCDSVDEDCDGVADNGNIASMCPATADVFDTVCDAFGFCQVNSCIGGFFDVDGVYGSGCECADDIAGGDIGAAMAMGAINNGDPNLLHNGRIPDPVDSDWFVVTFPLASGRPGAGAPTVSLTNNPGDNYRLNVYADTSGTTFSCSIEGGDSTARTSMSFRDDAGAPSNTYNTNNISWPDSAWVQVYRTGGGMTCDSYTLQASR